MFSRVIPNLANRAVATSKKSRPHVPVAVQRTMRRRIQGHVWRTVASTSTAGMRANVVEQVVARCVANRHIGLKVCVDSALVTFIN